MINEELLQRVGIGNLKNTVAVGHRRCTVPSNIKTAQRGNKLDSEGQKKRGRPKKTWQNTQAMTLMGPRTK